MRSNLVSGGGLILGGLAAMVVTRGGSAQPHSEPRP